MSAPTKPPKPARSARTSYDDDFKFHASGLRYKLIYAVGGLFLGSMSIVGGCILFLIGAVGKTSWTFQALGLAESNLTDAGPGVILFVIGLFIVLFTKFKVKDTRKKNGERRINYQQ